MIEQLQKGDIPMKKTIKIHFKSQPKPFILSSMFDSGNMDKVQIGINNTIIVTPANDCSGSLYQSHSKGWFYFSVSGGVVNTKIKIVIKRMSQLSSQNKTSQYFKPVYKYQKQQWCRLQSARTITKEDDTELHMQFQFGKNSTVYFAYTYPFSYEECEAFLKGIEKQAKKHKAIYYCDQVLIKSTQGRKIHLITVSSSHCNNNQTKNESKTQHKLQHHNKHQYKNTSQQIQKFQNEYLFPEKQSQALRFQNKKVIIISARVHPAQTPSSHTFNGILKFLLSKDARAYELRKNFVFKLIPMLNPDGVSNGHYRMDVHNQNLNRFYQSPDPLIQPSAYAVKQLGLYYSEQKTLSFYMDLHAHPQRKGNFIYGNAIQNCQQQVQTKLFTKILALNCIEFDYQNSSFDQKHMSLKDKNQALTKQGCGRVVFQKQLNQIYSYTMQCGYTCSTVLNQIVMIDKAHRKFEKHSIITDQFDNIKSPYYSGSKKTVYFNIPSYQALGKAVTVSILDLFNLNPASRIPNTPFKDLQGIRKNITMNISKGNNLTNFRNYFAKPNSQNNIKQTTTINSSKSINSVGALRLKPSVQKKTILMSSHFMFIQNKFISQKDEKKPQSSSDRRRIGMSTLPKVNLFKLNNLNQSLNQKGKIQT